MSWRATGMGRLLQELDALNAMEKNIYRADPATLAIWENVKRLRTSRAHRGKM